LNKENSRKTIFYGTIILVIFMKIYDYKDQIINRYRNYNPIFHEEKSAIELKNSKGKSLYIYLDDEIIIEYDNCDIHYIYEDKNDFFDAVEKVDNIINNKEAILNLYINNSFFASSSISYKDKYTKEDIIDIFNSFNMNSILEKEVKVTINFWDDANNYEIDLNI